jgi:predicted amidohydrolase
MKIKVAALCPTTEKENRKGEIIHQYAYPGATLAEAVKLANAFTDRGCDMIRQAASDGAKMVCLPEGLPNLGRWRIKIPIRIKRQAWLRTWDHFVEQIGKTAKECGIHVIAGAVEPKGGRFYNAACLFDPKGAFAGSYHKVQLAGGVKGEGKYLTPGDSLPVFPTPFGKVGLFICWDVCFPEITQGLMVNGAQILFLPTYGHAGKQVDFQAQSRAYDTVCPLVISMWCGNGRVIDKDGQILAAGSMDRDASGLIPDRIVAAEVDPLEPRKFINYTSYQTGLLAERQTRVYKVLTRPYTGTSDGRP